MPMLPTDRPTSSREHLVSISPLPGSGFISVFRPASSVSPDDPAPVHRMPPQDPLRLLTDGDRATIQAATGADHRPGGGTVHPTSMSTDDRAALSRVVGQVVAERADGRLSGELSADHLSTLFRLHGYHGPGAPRADGQDPGTGVDLLA